MSDIFKHMEEVRKKIEELKEYADIEGTELAEACHYICQLWNRSDYISGQLVECLEDEIDFQLKRFKEDYEIIEEESTSTEKYKRLEYKGN